MNQSTKQISNNLRDKILKNPATLVIKPGVCILNGKEYHYKPRTNKEILKDINKMLIFFEYWNKPWIYRLFHKEPKL